MSLERLVDWGRDLFDNTFFNSANNTKKHLIQNLFDNKVEKAFFQAYHNLKYQYPAITNAAAVQWLDGQEFAGKQLSAKDISKILEKSPLKTRMDTDVYDKYIRNAAYSIIEGMAADNAITEQDHNKIINYLTMFGPKAIKINEIKMNSSSASAQHLGAYELELDVGLKNPLKCFFKIFDPNRPDALQNELNVLKRGEKLGLSYIPKLYYSRGNVVVTSFTEGKDLRKIMNENKKVDSEKLLDSAFNLLNDYHEKMTSADAEFNPYNIFQKKVVDRLAENNIATLDDKLTKPMVYFLDEIKSYKTVSGHGDLHLGNVIKTNSKQGSSFMLTDFENAGEFPLAWEYYPLLADKTNKLTQKGIENQLKKQAKKLGINYKQLLSEYETVSLVRNLETSVRFMEFYNNTGKEKMAKLAKAYWDSELDLIDKMMKKYKRGSKKYNHLADLKDSLNNVAASGTFAQYGIKPEPDYHYKSLEARLPEIRSISARMLANPLYDSSSQAHCYSCFN